MGKDYLQSDRNNINFLNGLRKAAGAPPLIEGAAGRVYMTAEQHKAYQRTADAKIRAERAVKNSEAEADARMDDNIDKREAE